jgi:2-polyprenyl-3-methyl-5-hydroxy-6-metoxy-1,4-benzoquinol methylase
MPKTQSNKGGSALVRKVPRFEGLRDMNTRCSEGAVAYHSQLADTWEDRYRTGQFSLRLQIVSKILPEQQDGKKWLDAGCGTGTISRWLARERGASVIALDASERMLAHAAKISGVEYILGDVTCSGLPDGSFDGILCSSVLEYLPDPAVALREFRRLIRPGGIILLSVPNAAQSVRMILWIAYWITRPLRQRRLFSYLDHSRHSFSEPGVAQLLRENGFALSTTLQFGRINLPFRLYVPSAATLLMARGTTTSDRLR